MLTWEEVGIVLPHRQPAILYEWNQLLLLRVLYHLRQSWTFKQIEKALKQDNVNLDQIIGKIDKTVLVAIGQNEGLIFKFWNSDNIGELESGKSIFELCNSEEFFVRAEVGTESIFSTPKAVIVVVPKLIKEMKKIAEEFQIESFDLKVG